MKTTAPIAPMKYNILIVDDSRDNLRLLSGILVQEGYVVRPVLDGVLAISSAQTNPPDLILLDIMMPGMTGYEICEKLKTDEALRDIPVIFISALNSVMDKVKAFSIGGVDYITKPFQPQEVLARIRTHLTIRQLQHTLQQKNLELEQEIRERKRIEDAMRKRNWELDLLNQMTNALQGCQTEDTTYLVLQEICPQLFPNESGCLYLLNEHQAELKVVAAWGGTPPAASVLKDADWNIAGGRIFTFEQPKKKPVHLHVACRDETDGVPYALRNVDKEMLGLLFFSFEQCNYDEFDEDSIRQAESKQLISTRVAEQYALYLTNIRMRMELQMQVTRDPLTNLYNRRYMEETLANEVRRVVRKRASLGVLMIDVDHFKTFNDTYGHESGDVILQELSALFQKNIRGGDIACRYGGEEFLLILPDTTLEIASQRANELLRRVRELRVISQQHEHRITVSVGVAAAPEHGQDVHGLVNAADTALYYAKHNGRNQVVVFSDRIRPLLTGVPAEPENEA